MDNLKCNYLATSPPFILQAVRSRRMKQVILEVDKIQLVVHGVQQPTLEQEEKKASVYDHGKTTSFSPKCRPYKKDRPSRNVCGSTAY